MPANHPQALAAHRSCWTANIHGDEFRSSVGSTAVPQRLLSSVWVLVQLEVAAYPNGKNDFSLRSK
jgi:hypothetical protein